MCVVKSKITHIKKHVLYHHHPEREAQKKNNSKVHVYTNKMHTRVYE